MSFNLSSLIGGMHDDEQVFNIAHVDVSKDSFVNKGNPEVKENNANKQTEVNNPKRNDQSSAEGGFNPNEMFNIGIRNVEGNPFSKEELTNLSNELDTRSDPNNAQTLVIEGFESNAPIDSFETNMQESSPTVVAEEDGKGFEILGATSLGATSLTESTIAIEEGEISISLEPQTDGISMFEELAKNAEEVDSAKYAEQFNPNAVVTSESSADDSDNIIIDEADSLTIDETQPSIVSTVETNEDELQIEVLDTSIDEQKEFDYISKMEEIHGNETHSTPNDNATLQADYYKSLATEQSMGEPNGINATASKPVRTEIPVTTKESDGVVPLFGTQLGDKYRLNTEHTKSSKFETTNPHIMDFSELVVGTEYEGEVYVTDVAILPYGTNNNTRVEWSVETKNKAKHKFTQFNLKDDITKDELKVFIGNTITITGKVGTRNDKKNFVVNLVGVAKCTTPADFGVGVDNQTKSPDNEIEMYKNWYRSLTAEIKTPWLRSLIKECLEKNGNLVRMLNSSAGTKVHDSGEAGLFKHTMKVTMNAHLVSKNYPFVNHDVIIVSSLLHDIGKIYEMSNGKYTQMGELTGHIVIGQTMVSNAIQALKNSGVEVNENESANVIHCILAHHGNLEWGSPVKPKTPEAMLLHLVDMIDARLTHMDESLSGEDKAYSKTFGTSVFNLN